MVNLTSVKQDVVLLLIPLPWIFICHQTSITGCSKPVVWFIIIFTVDLSSPFLEGIHVLYLKINFQSFQLKIKLLQT